MIINIEKSFLPFARWQPYNEKQLQMWYADEMPEKTKEGYVFKAVKDEKYFKTDKWYKNEYPNKVLTTIPYKVHYIRSISQELVEEYKENNWTGLPEDVEPVPDFNTGIYTFKVKVQRKLGCFDCIGWLIYRGYTGKPYREIDFAEHFVTKRKIFGISIPFTKKQFFRFAIHQAGKKQIKQDVVIRKKIYKKCKGEFTIEMEWQEDKIVFSLRVENGVNSAFVWVFDYDKETLKNLREAKYDLVMNAGTTDGKDGKEHSIILKEFAYV